MGICTSAGVIRDFAGPYFVSVSHIQIRSLLNFVSGVWAVCLYGGSLGSGIDLVALQ